MITFTYAAAGCLLAVTGYLFWQGALTSATQTLAWTCVFFFASAGASAAYLTVSEIFPLEIRAMAIAFLLCRGAGSWDRRSVAVRQAHRNIRHECVLRLPTRSRYDADGRARRIVLGGEGRGSVTRIHCDATFRAEDIRRTSTHVIDNSLQPVFLLAEQRREEGVARCPSCSQNAQ